MRFLSLTWLWVIPYNNNSLLTPSYNLAYGDVDAGVVRCPRGSTVVRSGETVPLLIWIEGQITERLDIAILQRTSSDSDDAASSSSLKDELSNPKITPATFSLFPQAFPKSSQQNVTVEIFGRAEGRYILTYELSGPDAPGFILNTEEAAILVAPPNFDGWSEVYLQLLLNVLIFSLGFVYFIVRRVLKFYLPFWKDHDEGLFQRSDDSSDPRPLMARMQHFFTLPCDGPWVIYQCGMNAALCLRMYFDLMIFCGCITLFSCVLVLPVVRVVNFHESVKFCFQMNKKIYIINLRAK